MPRLQQRLLSSQEWKALKQETTKGSGPLGDGSPACTRMNPTKWGTVLVLCCKLGMVLLCLGAVGKAVVCICKNFSHDAFNSSSLQDYNQSGPENLTFLLGQGPQPTSSSDLPLESIIRLLAKNYTFTNKTNPIGRTLITMLRNDSLPLGTILNILQSLELGIENRKRRSTSLEEQVQDLVTADLEVKTGKRTVFVKIGDR